MGTTVIRSPLVSVIVPIYGVAPYLEAALTSVMQQSYKRLQIICIIDGDDAECLEIATKMARKRRRMRVFTQENQGIGATRNRGLQLARGKYVTFVDGDDIVPPHAYELMVDSAESNDADMVAGVMTRISAEGKTYPSWAHNFSNRMPIENTHISDYPLLGYDRMVCNKLMRRDLLAAHKIKFPEYRFEDYIFSLQAHWHAQRVNVLADSVYHWQVRPSGDSITLLTKDLRTTKERIDSNNKVLDFIESTRCRPLALTVMSHFAAIDIPFLIRTWNQFPSAQAAEIKQLVRDFSRRMPHTLPGILPSYEWMRAAAAHEDYVFANALTRSAGRRLRPYPLTDTNIPGWE